jgi:hypothetical protein
MNAVHRVFIGFSAAPPLGLMRALARVIPLPPQRPMKTSAKVLVFLLRTGMREACFCAGTVKQNARMNAVHRVFIGFSAAPPLGLMRALARVIPLPPLFSNKPADAGLFVLRQIEAINN